MKTLSSLSRVVFNGLYNGCEMAAASRRLSDVRPVELSMDKCLIVSKMTRYEYERHRYKTISEDELQRLLRKRGSDYDALVAHHETQKKFERRVVDTLRAQGFQVKVAGRWSYNNDLIKWCDVVIPVGGDGTFLLAASKVKNNSKPVIGFNSAPSRSVGRLCLPRWCSHDVRGAIQSLKEGRFRWMRRSRIRTTITCEAKIENAVTPVDLHTAHLSRYEAEWQSYETPEHVPPPECVSPPRATNGGLTTQSLPFLALNEVFIGESVSARVSHFAISVDGGEAAHTKSSGLCVTSGTGSTSWHLSINCLRTQSVLDLLRLAAADAGGGDTSLERATRLTHLYNKALQFPPDASRLAYSVRELIAGDDWPPHGGLKARDYANTIRVVSHCVDAGLVIDGSVSFPFNDGAVALLQTIPEDSLRTVVMQDEEDR